MERYSGIEKLSNYSTEGNIKWIKQMLHSSTTHFGGKEGDLCWCQLLRSSAKRIPYVDWCIDV